MTTNYAKRLVSSFLGLVFVLPQAVIFADPGPIRSEMKMVSTTPAFRSDDGSIIRSMPGIGGVESVHCLLPKRGVIKACRHKTVSQIWYVLEGTGEIWLKDLEGMETVSPLSKGTSFTVPLGFTFQFRNTGDNDLSIFIVNTTPWSGADELIPVADHWTPATPTK